MYDHWTFRRIWQTTVLGGLFQPAKFLLFSDVIYLKLVVTINFTINTLNDYLLKRKDPNELQIFVCSFFDSKYCCIFVKYFSLVPVSI